MPDCNGIELIAIYKWLNQMQRALKNSNKSQYKYARAMMLLHINNLP